MESRQRQRTAWILVMLAMWGTRCHIATDRPAMGAEPTTAPSDPAERLAGPAALAKSLPCKAEFITVAGQPGFVLLPLNQKGPRPIPWVWYAPTFKTNPHAAGAQQWMFKRLLDKGIAIGGVDVGDILGSPRNRALFQCFYKEATKRFGLAPKAALLPQSRGGLMLYNWAVEHPDRVSCIGGIYPVCDYNSYPPNRDWLRKSYELTDEQLESRQAEHNPIARLAPLAKAGVPILHVHGDNDVVVPLERNSAELVRRYKELGGKCEVIVISGKGHAEILEFFQNDRLVEFFIGHSLKAAPAAETPLPQRVKADRIQR